MVALKANKLFPLRHLLKLSINVVEFPPFSTIAFLYESFKVSNVLLEKKPLKVTKCKPRAQISTPVAQSVNGSFAGDAHCKPSTKKTLFLCKVTFMPPSNYRKSIKAMIKTIVCSAVKLIKDEIIVKICCSSINLVVASSVLLRRSLFLNNRDGPVVETWQ